MPEITTVETVRTKLREFDARMEGAIVAAKTLNRVRDDAEKLLEKIQGFSQKSEHAQRQTESVRLQMEQLQQEWADLKERVARAVNETDDARGLLVSEYDSVVQSLNGKLTEAEERLRTTNRESLTEQADLMKRLEDRTRLNAESASEAKSLALEQADKLSQLLNSVRNDLQNDIRAKLRHSEEMLEFQLETMERQLVEKLQMAAQNLDSEFQKNSQALSETVINHEHTICEQIRVFQDDMKRHLSEYQQSVDRQITDFLNRQNAMIQNLTQQIDSYQRVSQALSSELQSTKAQLNQLQILVSSIRDNQASHGQELSKIGTVVKSVSARMEETVKRLMSLPVIGNKFK